MPWYLGLVQGGCSGCYWYDDFDIDGAPGAEWQLFPYPDETASYPDSGFVMPIVEDGALKHPFSGSPSNILTAKRASVVRPICSGIAQFISADIEHAFQSSTAEFIPDTGYWADFRCLCALTLFANPVTGAHMAILFSAESNGGFLGQDRVFSVSTRFYYGPTQTEYDFGESYSSGYVPLSAIPDDTTFYLNATAWASGEYKIVLNGGIVVEGIAPVGFSFAGGYQGGSIGWSAGTAVEQDFLSPEFSYMEGGAICDTPCETLIGWYGFDGNGTDVNGAANSTVYPDPGYHGGPYDLVDLSSPPTVEHFYNPNSYFYNSECGDVGTAEPQSQIMQMPDLDGVLAVMRAWCDTDLAACGGDLGYTSQIDFQFQGTIAVAHMILWFVIGASITGEGGFFEPAHYLSYYQSMQWQLTFYDPAYAYTGAMLDHGTQVISYGVDGWGASVTGAFPTGLVTTTVAGGVANHSLSGPFVSSNAFATNARNQVNTQYIAGFSGIGGPVTHPTVTDVSVMPELLTAYGIGYTPGELQAFMGI